MTDHYFLPDVPVVDATPELLCRIMDQLPEHQEGDYVIAVSTGSLADLLEAAGHDVTIGYQNFGGNAEDPEPQPEDGPDYHAELPAWLQRQIDAEDPEDGDPYK